MPSIRSGSTNVVKSKFASVRHNSIHCAARSSGNSSNVSSSPPFRHMDVDLRRLLFAGMLLCRESPRWLARQDHWEKAKEVLGIIRHLPVEHPYVEMELQDRADQQEMEVCHSEHLSEVTIS
jgi:hypothetical protein